MARRRGFTGQLRAALVVGGITLGILLLLFSHFALPYWIGPAGLVVVGIVDAVIILVVRHRRSVRRRAHAAPWTVGGPAAHHAGPNQDEFVVTIALLCFVVGLSISGLTLQSLLDHPGSAIDFVLFQVGVVVLVIGDILLWPYEWRLYDGRTESEKYDTTDDH